MHEIHWPILLILLAVIAGVLLSPYDLLLILQRIWEQRRRDRIARGVGGGWKYLGYVLVGFGTQKLHVQLIQDGFGIEV
jgi:hypothetical protein